jgi:hypothetical protein
MRTPEFWQWVIWAIGFAFVGTILSVKAFRFLRQPGALARWWETVDLEPPKRIALAVLAFLALSLAFNVGKWLFLNVILPIYFVLAASLETIRPSATTVIIILLSAIVYLLAKIARKESYGGRRNANNHRARLKATRL